MEIIPGQGIPQVPLGADRQAVHAALGTPSVVSGQEEHHNELDPAVVVHYDHGGTVQTLEIPYSGTPGNEVTLDGIQLTFRPLPQVIADLASAGFVGMESDIGMDYPDGFSIWSMGSLMIEDIDQPGDAGPDDEVVEGVSIAAAGYFEGA